MKRDILTFLLFLLLAAMLWYGHAMQSVRNTVVPVLIQYTGKPGTIGLGGAGLPDTVMIEVRDAGYRLNTYHSDPLHLSIDLRQYIHGEKGTIRVPSDALRRSISDILQGTSHLIDTKPEELVCSYYTEREKTVNIVLAGSLETADEYQLIDKPQLSPAKTKIYGSEKALNAIDTLYTQPTELSGLSDTASFRIALAIPAGMRAETDSIDLRVLTERFTEKKFTIPLRAINAPEGYILRLFPEEVEVSIRVGINHFAKVKPQDIQASCVYSPNRTDKLDVELHYTNPHITAAWAYPGVVEFLLIEK